MCSKCSNTPRSWPVHCSWREIVIPRKNRQMRKKSHRRKIGMTIKRNQEKILKPITRIIQVTILESIQVTILGSIRLQLHERDRIADFLNTFKFQCNVKCKMKKPENSGKSLNINQCSIFYFNLYENFFLMLR